MAGKKKYFCNVHYFDEIDSPEKAYWLGYIMADGCVIHRKSVRKLKTKTAEQHRFLFQLSTKEEDVDHLRKFLDCIESTHPINIYHTKTNFGAKNYGRVVIEDEHLFRSLIKHGVYERKSLIVGYPDIPCEYDPDFIRGYFDGNGCIYDGVWFECNLTSTFEMLQQIFNRMPLNDDKKFAPVQRYPERDNNSWCLRFAGNRQVYTTLSWMYSTSQNTTRLDRKYALFTKLEELNGRPVQQ